MLDEVPVERVPAWPRNTDHRLAPGVAPVVRRKHWDVIHVQCYQSLVAPIAMAAAARAGTPYVVTFHGGGHSSRLRHKLRSKQLRVLRPLLARSAALVATAEWEIGRYSELLGLPRTQFRLIPNGGDLPQPPASTTPKAAETLIVSLGRAERYKGHHRVVAALPHVLREVHDARLWIAGEGPYERELADLAARLGVADRVEIRSVRDRAHYTEKLASASVATLLSDFETHPMAALEAINLGLPLLVADNSGLAELADRGQAKAVPLTGDSRAHAAEIVRLVRHPPTPSTVAISSWRECANALHSLYEEAHAGRHS
jgi:glycosyltransferase involved in cell wall biosynthesis